MVNQAHLDEWIAELRTTTLMQGQGKMYRRGEFNEMEFCCLGVGEKMCGLITEEMLDKVTLFGPPLASLGFLAWLGVEQPDSSSSMGYDLTLDVPFEIEEWDHETEDYEESGEPFTTSWLNDGAGLTFPQIADMLDYFGIKSAR